MPNTLTDRELRRKDFSTLEKGHRSDRQELCPIDSIAAWLLPAGNLAIPILQGPLTSNDRYGQTSLLEGIAQYRPFALGAASRSQTTLRLPRMSGMLLPSFAPSCL